MSRASPAGCCPCVTAWRRGRSCFRACRWRVSRWEIALAVAPRRRRLVAAVLGAEALQAGPRLDQRAIDREVIVRLEALDLGMPLS